MTNSNTQILKIHTGTDNFHELRMESDVLVDKSLFIEEFLGDGSKVLLLTRPRRWGKSMNMDMLGKFLQIEVDENGVELPKDKKIYEKLFLGEKVKLSPTSNRTKSLSPLKIAAYQERVDEYLGKYPVVRLNFKGVDGDSYEKIEEGVRTQVIRAFDAHPYIADYLDENSRFFNVEERDMVSRYKKIDLPFNSLLSSIRVLTQILNKHYGKQVYVLIDEYDSPINRAFVKLYDKNPEEFESVLSLFRGIFGEALKTNDYLKKGLVTGILRIAKADLFSGINNFNEYGVLDSKFAKHYGFNQEEVNSLLEQVPVKVTKEAIKEWYNGYIFSGEVRYNPWSIMRCLDNEGKTENYWIDTGGTTLIDSVLLSDDIQEELQELLNGKGLIKTIFKQITFNELKYDTNVLFSLLVFAGYLNPVFANDNTDDSLYHITIPNKEVRNMYAKRIIGWLSRKLSMQSSDDYKYFIGLLTDKKLDKFKEALATYLLTSTSFHDLTGERDYHNLMGGLISPLSDRYRIDSNRESGHGRADHILIPKDSKNARAFILEYKVSKSEADNLKILAETGLKQIRDNAYFAKAKEYNNVKEIVCVSMAFYGKNFELVYKVEVV